MALAGRLFGLESRRRRSLTWTFSNLSYEKPLDLIAGGQYQKVVSLLLALVEGVTI